MTKYALIAGAAAALVSTSAWADASSGHKDQARGEQEIPVCTHRIGTLAIVPPDKEWWRELNLGSPEEEALPEGYARKTDIRWGAYGGYASWWGGFAAAGASGYQNTEIGQVIVLAYLDAY